MPVLHRRIKTRQRRKNRKVFSRKRKNISYSVGRNTRKKSIKRGGNPMSSAYKAAMDEMIRAGLGEYTQGKIAQAQADKKAGIAPYKQEETDKPETDKPEPDKPDARKRWQKLSHIV